MAVQAHDKVSGSINMKLVGFNATVRKKKVRVYINPEFIQVIESVGDSCAIHLNYGQAILVENISAEAAIELITKSEPLWHTELRDHRLDMVR